MKNYFIDKYLTIYEKKQFKDTQHVQRWKVSDLDSGKTFLKAVKCNYVENDRGLSAYESYKMLVKESADHYKIFYKEATKDGVIKENV